MVTFRAKTMARSRASQQRPVAPDGDKFRPDGRWPM